MSIQHATTLNTQQDSYTHVHVHVVVGFLYMHVVILRVVCCACGCMNARTANMKHPTVQTGAAPDQMYSVRHELAPSGCSRRGGEHQVSHALKPLPVHVTDEFVSHVQLEKALSVLAHHVVEADFQEEDVTRRIAVAASEWRVSIAGTEGVGVTMRPESLGSLCKSDDAVVLGLAIGFLLPRQRASRCVRLARAGIDGGHGLGASAPCRRGPS